MKLNRGGRLGEGGARGVLGGRRLTLVVAQRLDELLVRREVLRARRHPECQHSWLAHHSEPESRCNHDGRCSCLAYRDPDEGGTTFVEREEARGARRRRDPVRDFLDEAEALHDLAGRPPLDEIVGVVGTEGDFGLPPYYDGHGRVYVRIHDVDLRAIKKIRELALGDEARSRADTLDRIAALAGDLLERYQTPEGPPK